MHPMLRLCEDILSNGAAIELPARPRMIFIVHGSIEIQERTVTGGEAWHGEGAVTLTAGAEGATGWRFELAPEDADDKAVFGGGTASRHKLSARLDSLPDGDLLLRGDSVAFPPGGCAYLHRHQGPGLRCLLEGGIRIDTHGASTCYGPGGAWYESGPEPVFAQAAADRPSRFIRVMVLPRPLIGKSSIRYVDEADKTRPKSQQYQIFCDAPIARP